MKQSEAMKIVSEKIAYAKQLLEEAEMIAEEYDIVMHAEVDFNGTSRSYHVEDWDSSSAYC